jgi:hypothetical protein
MRLIDYLLSVFKVKKENIEEQKGEEGKTPNAKKVYVYVNNKKAGGYDSITKCGIALGMSRPMVKKVIENGITLDNGFKLSFN